MIAIRRPRWSCNDAHMRTTVTIDDEVYEEVRQIAFESHRTLDEVIEMLLVKGLKVVAPPPARRRLGELRGTITIADDFDEAPREVLDSLDAPANTGQVRR